MAVPFLITVQPANSRKPHIEANASLHALEHRNTQESYWKYVRRLAAEAGIDPKDCKAVRRSDRQREGRKTSNQEWQNPHDPGTKVGLTKDGACDMIHKPEHITDLESSAIVRAAGALILSSSTDNWLKAVLVLCCALQS